MRLVENARCMLRMENYKVYIIQRKILLSVMPKIGYPLENYGEVHHLKHGIKGIQLWTLDIFLLSCIFTHFGWKTKENGW